ncbi:two-component response regulator ssk1p [Ophiostoma piceae UAMH 11346]|uniref:Two-component response regulator ssk1p n=1 Tax=Ophiostoma piceae (strain UAMH 11346) TaxID=1262450 RepID=S3BW91_OPHP1|nr:two-component response regulator ssk1p [Ophiostoma piceae UAMH 11346]
MASTAPRKVWVRRPGATATLVAFGENDVVDDVCDMLLRKYANSLGRMYDAPDVSLRLTPREAQQEERVLGPDESIARALDMHYPGGQNMDEALNIDVPVRRVTPLASPRGGPPHAFHASSARRDSHDHLGPNDSRVDYFGPGVVPEYYNHGALTAGSEYGSAIGPDAAYARSSGSQHLYPPPASHHHAHGQSHKSHTLNLRSPPGGGAGGAAATPPQAGGAVPGGSPLNHPHSISILGTGQAPPIPNLPSPGGTVRRSHKDRSDRPKLNRQVSAISEDGTGSGLSSQIGSSGGALLPPGQGQGPNSSKVSIATPVSKTTGRNIADGLNLKAKGGDAALDTLDSKAVNGSNASSGHSSRSAMLSPPRPMSPMRGGKKQKKAAAAAAAAVAARVDDDRRPEPFDLGPLTVPPINVLIVEDNIINLKLLEAFVKRLKVRWQTAMNGVDAVAKWRTGGFHLVLMDIQLPLMSGLDATREIRRLERVNSIGVFASTPSDSIGDGRDPRSDKLANIALFKSPVIIVALTASSLQSDRNDALAAGCNDFLTKPVNFLWLEKKIMEWGCMQALIDFDGWRKWKELKLPSDAANAADAESRKSKKDKTAGHTKRPSMSSVGHENPESSDTVNTLSSGDSVPTVTSASAGIGPSVRSPLSNPVPIETIDAVVEGAQ